MSDEPIPLRPSPSLRSEHSEATRQALIACGRAAFGTTGYHDGGIEAVARAARVSRGALYHHFRDKRALFEAVVIQMQAEAADEVASRADAAHDAWTQLADGVEALLEICQRSEYRRIVLEDAAAVLGKARCTEIENAHPMGVLKAKLSALQETGRLTDVNAAVLGALLGAMICEGAVLLSADAHEDRAAPDRVRIVLRTFLDAFRAPTTPSAI